MFIHITVLLIGFTIFSAFLFNLLVICPCLFFYFCRFVLFLRSLYENRKSTAKKLLIKEPDTSVLAISIMTGFQSQSNFYTAFREITEESPGNYRKKRINL